MVTMSNVESTATLRRSGWAVVVLWQWSCARQQSCRPGSNLTPCTRPSSSSFHCAVCMRAATSRGASGRVQAQQGVADMQALTAIWPWADVCSMIVAPTHMQTVDSCLKALHENRHLKEELQGERKRRKIAMDALSWSGAPQALQTLLPPGPLPQQSTVQLPMQPMAQPTVPLQASGRLLCLSAHTRCRVPTGSCQQQCCQCCRQAAASKAVTSRWCSI